MSAPAGPTAAYPGMCDERCWGTCDGRYEASGGVHYAAIRHAHRPNVCRNWRCDEWGPIHHGTPKHRQHPRMPGECAACDAEHDAAFGTGYVLTEYERTHTAAECVEHDKTELKADLSRALTERDAALARVKALEIALDAAASSLEWIHHGDSEPTEKMTNAELLVERKAYAGSRAHSARAALAKETP